MHRDKGAEEWTRGPSLWGLVEAFPSPTTCSCPCTPGGQMGISGARTRESLSVFAGGCPVDFVALGNCSTSLSVSCLVSLELSGGHVWGA